jgi:hypothetical protein
MYANIVVSGFLSCKHTLSEKKIITVYFLFRYKAHVGQTNKMQGCTFTVQLAAAELNNSYHGWGGG